MKLTKKEFLEAVLKIVNEAEKATVPINTFTKDHIVNNIAAYIIGLL